MTKAQNSGSSSGNAPKKRRQRMMASPFVAKAVRVMSGGHKTEPDTDFLRTESFDGEHCELRSTFESHWVASLCNYSYLSCFQKRQNAAFDKVFEIPSLHSESRDHGGYDLSIGPFDTKLRHRLMFKTVSKRWCDTDWSWSSHKENDKDHLHSMTGSGHSPLKCHQIYLALNVFYCIHDWRRMGLLFTDIERANDQYIVPQYQSLLRTIIIDINGLKDGYDDELGIEIVRNRVEYDGSSGQQYLDRISSSDKIQAQVGGKKCPVISIDELCARIDMEWNSGGGWVDSYIR